MSLCRTDKGFIRDRNGLCVCPPGYAMDVYENCSPCVIEKGFKIDDSGHCVCALERGMVIDERGRCVCPIQHGYTLTELGECVPNARSPGCVSDAECADNKYCNIETKLCEDPCIDKTCGMNAFCNATRHRAICQCLPGYTGDAETWCSKYFFF